MKKNVNKLQIIWPEKGMRKDPDPQVMIEDIGISHISPRRFGNDDIYDNLLIYGDNSPALKSIEPILAGSIKCIFVDPPYNTGSDFAHYDDGIEHSLWLSMLASRIQLLHRFLSEDGSFWISIDDTEAHYLKVLCDEIFERKNFVANIIWQKKYTVANDAKWFSNNHDHILVYAKNKSLWRPNRLPRSEKMNTRYTNPDDHPKGPWKATPLHAKSGSENLKSFSYTFKNGLTWSPPPGTYPRYSLESLRRLEAGDEIWFGKNGRSQPSRKTFLSELTNDGVPPQTIWLHEDVGHNHEAKTEIKMFNADDVFGTPKPEKLLYRIIHIATDPGDTVLDGFAGSGTTGAVAHKMGRRWIMIELGEHCHTHIVPRLVKVVDGDDPGGITGTVGWKGGGGFRYCRMASPLPERDKRGNRVISKHYNPEMLSEAMCRHMGFTYAPSRNPDEYWNHGHSSETDFVFVTTRHLTRPALAEIAEDIGPDRSLLICCPAFDADPDAFGNLTIRKIPSAVLKKCERERDDYSLAAANLPIAADDEGEGTQPDAPPGDLPLFASSGSTREGGRQG